MGACTGGMQVIHRWLLGELDAGSAPGFGSAVACGWSSFVCLLDSGLPEPCRRHAGSLKVSRGAEACRWFAACS